MTHSEEPPAKPGSLIHKSECALRELALAYPEAWEDFPWGHSAFKVGKKVFMFLSSDAKRLSLSVKLPESNFEALLLPFTEPTGYGLGKSGWVSATFDHKQRPPIALIALWIEESYRAIALKGLVKQLNALRAGDAPAKVSKPPAEKTAKKTAKKVAKKKAKTQATKKRAAKKATRKR